MSTTKVQACSLVMLESSIWRQAAGAELVVKF